MRFLQRRRHADRILDNLGDSLGGFTDWTKRRSVVKAGMIAGGLAALTAGSAAISSLRRRMESDS